MHHSKYLGSSVEETGGMATEITQRVSASKRNWKRCSGVLCDRSGYVKRMKEDHIVRRMLDVDIPGKLSRGRPNLRWEDVWQSDIYKGRAERGQHNKQGSMEEEANQLYRRPQMTGQAKDELEECSSVVQ